MTRWDTPEINLNAINNALIHALLCTEPHPLVAFAKQQPLYHMLFLHNNTVNKKNTRNEITKQSLNFLKYRIAENVGGRKLWRIWRSATNSPKFYLPIAYNV